MSCEADITADDSIVIETRDLESGDESMSIVSDEELLTYRRPEAA